MKTTEIAIITTLDAGHVAPSLELGKTLTSHDHRISVTIFIVDSPFKSKLTSSTQTLLSNKPLPRMRFILSTVDQPTSDQPHSMSAQSRVKEFYSSESTHRPKAFVVDMLCTAFAELASELGVPTYLFYTSSACAINLMCYLQFLYDDQNQDLSVFKDSDTELPVPGFVNPVPAKVLPLPAVEKVMWSAIFVHAPRMIRKCKGILANTIAEMESYAIKCLSEDDKFPPIYPIGPVLNLKTGTSSNPGQYEEIMTWLDNQPSASVVFLCFGSLGMFEREQVVEIALALEQSGHRFLWALRRPPTKDSIEPSSEHKYIISVLPQGFLDRTKEIGKVIGWAPQVAVLSHAAVGGFVSHCGWNSILESLSCGVPIAAWPLYAEQQMNAFEMVKELGLAVEIKIDYQQGNSAILTAEEIKRGIKHLMIGSEGAKIKSKVNAMRDEIHRAVLEGGSSYVAVGQFIEDVINICL